MENPFSLSYSHSTEKWYSSVEQIISISGREPELYLAGQALRPPEKRRKAPLNEEEMVESTKPYRLPDLKFPKPADEAKTLRERCEDGIRQLNEIARQNVEQTTVNHPPHYNQHPSGIECIDVVRHMNFNQGNAVKYIWRSGLKTTNVVEDLKKAIWYLEDELKRLTPKG